MTGPPIRPMMIKAFAAIAWGLAATTAGLAAGSDMSSVASPRRTACRRSREFSRKSLRRWSLETKGRVAPDPKSRRRDSRDVYISVPGWCMTRNGTSLSPTTTSSKRQRYHGDANGRAKAEGQTDRRRPGFRPGRHLRAGGRPPRSRSGTLASSRSAISSSPSAIPGT